MSGKQPQINACLPCRKVKMKCVTTHGSRCDRCARKSLQCVFREHCRGRKPGVRLTRKEGSRPERSNMGTAPTGRARPDFWDESDSFQPHSLLNHQAMRGKFSLQNILSVDHGSDARLSEPGPHVDPDDPVVLGLVNEQVAISLLEYFMQKMNPYISQLDPVLHTFTYIRKSPFLLTTVLAAAAKAFESNLYPDLIGHAENLFAGCFRRGDKSTEIIQAILLLTYWKEPSDTRAWTSVGLAIRIALDLGWHKLSRSIGNNAAGNDIQRREVRNVERTFLVLFVYDRSLSLQTGKPWMIERNHLTEAAESWCQDPLASPNDQLLSSFVALRLLAADTFDLLSPCRTNPVSRAERPLSILDSRIAAWQGKWLALVSTDCHVFLVKFYGLHLRLQLFSMPLQQSRIKHGEPIQDFKPLWLSFESALAMLQLVTASSSLLYLAQDSVHVMTAYAAIFLTKLLFSSPPTITSEIESTAMTAIRDAASSFVSLSAPHDSSCTYQARFLENILSKYDRFRHSRMDLRQQIAQVCPALSGLINPYDISRDKVLRILPAPPNAGPSSMSIDGHHDSYQSVFNALPQTYTNELLGGTRDFMNRTSDSFEISLGDEGIWEDLFANAGFSIQEGVFFF
ncbi:hypothetical protein BDW66DRAFT_162867 [Aspergillus desertorum]